MNKGRAGHVGRSCGRFSRAGAQSARWGMASREAGAHDLRADSEEKELEGPLKAAGEH